MHYLGIKEENRTQKKLFHRYAFLPKKNPCLMHWSSTLPTLAENALRVPFWLPPTLTNKAMP